MNATTAHKDTHTRTPIMDELIERIEQLSVRRTKSAVSGYDNMKHGADEMWRMLTSASAGMQLAAALRARKETDIGLPHDAETQEGARQILDELESGDMEVSYRNYVPLKPEEIKALRTYLEQKQ